MNKKLEFIVNPMIKILRKEGWDLNPNDKIVNGILKRLEICNGECPCNNPGETTEDRLCPCKSYEKTIYVTAHYMLRKYDRDY